MAFPVSPTEGQTYTEDNTVWIYSAVTGQWNRSVVNPGNSTDYRSGKGYVGSDLTVDGDLTLDDGGTFTTTLQTITPTANRTVSLPNATGTVALVAGSSGQLVWNNAGAQAGVPGSTVGATGDVTLALNGAASTPPLELTGTWFTGGNTTTTKPQVLIEPAGTTSNAWSPDGTGLGVNAASTFTGRLLDLQRNGTSRVVVTGAGNVGIGTTSPEGQLAVIKSAAGGTVITFSDNVNATGRLGTPSSQVVAFGGNTDHNIVFGGWAINGTSLVTERMRIKSTGIVNIANTPTYADNAAATAGGLVAGDVYRTSTGQLMIRF